MEINFDFDFSNPASASKQLTCDPASQYCRILSQSPTIYNKRIICFIPYRELTSDHFSDFQFLIPSSPLRPSIPAEHLPPAGQCHNAGQILRLHPSMSSLGLDSFRVIGRACLLPCHRSAFKLSPSVSSLGLVSFRVIPRAPDARRMRLGRPAHSSPPAVADGWGLCRASFTGRARLAAIATRQM